MAAPLSPRRRECPDRSRRSAAQVNALDLKLEAAEVAAEAAAATAGAGGGAAEPAQAAVGSADTANGRDDEQSK